MDVSKEYIEMCRKAEEIQKQWQFKAGDVYEESNRVVVLPAPMHPFKEAVWIPRQDQLQEMMSSIVREVLFYNQIILDRWDRKDDKDATMEQLWLLLVMDRKYSKTWNGSEWVVA